MALDAVIARMRATAAARFIHAFAPSQGVTPLREPQTPTGHFIPDVSKQSLKRRSRKTLPGSRIPRGDPLLVSGVGVSSTEP